VGRSGLCVGRLEVHVVLLGGIHRLTLWGALDWRSGGLLTIRDVLRLLSDENMLSRGVVLLRALLLLLLYLLLHEMSLSRAHSVGLGLSGRRLRTEPRHRLGDGLGELTLRGIDRGCRLLP
jgi:hypothetical protein